MPLKSEQRQGTDSDSNAAFSVTVGQVSEEPSSIAVMNEQKVKLFNEMSEKGLLQVSDRIGMIGGSPDRKMFLNAFEQEIEDECAANDAEGNDDSEPMPNEH